MRRWASASVAMLVLLSVVGWCCGQEPGPSYQHLKFLERLVGNWRTQYELNGQKTEGTFQARWAPGKYCITWSAETWAKDDRKPLSHGSGVIAWDAAEKRVRELAAMSDGSIATAYFDEVDGKIVIDRSGVLADGTKIKTRPVGVFTADRFEFQGSEWTTADGKVVQKIGGGFFQRVEKPAKPTP